MKRRRQSPPTRDDWPQFVDRQPPRRRRPVQPVRLEGAAKWAAWGAAFYAFTRALGPVGMLVVPVVAVLLVLLLVTAAVHVWWVALLLVLAVCWRLRDRLIAEADWLYRLVKDRPPF